MLAILDLKVFAILFLALAVALLLANAPGWGIAEPGAQGHDAGLTSYPSPDCGNNFWKVFVTVRGDECFTRGDSAAKVERAIEEVEPGFFDQPFTEITRAAWDNVLGRALTWLGW